MLRTAEEQRGNSQSLRGGSHAGARQALVQAFDSGPDRGPSLAWARVYAPPSGRQCETAQIQRFSRRGETHTAAAKSAHAQAEWKPGRHPHRAVLRARASWPSSPGSPFLPCARPCGPGRSAAPRSNCWPACSRPAPLPSSRRVPATLCLSDRRRQLPARERAGLGLERLPG